jgi:membrane-associated phospholipid phosphatase
VALLGLVIVGVAVARIYLLAHYASDVLGGLVLGTGVAVLVIWSIPAPTGVPHPDGETTATVVGPASAS